VDIVALDKVKSVKVNQWIKQDAEIQYYAAMMKQNKDSIDPMYNIQLCLDHNTLSLDSMYLERYMKP
jgi:hypothetical protein